MMYEYEEEDWVEEESSTEEEGGREDGDGMRPRQSSPLIILDGE